MEQARPEAEGAAPAAPQTPVRSGRDRVIKLVFVIVTLAAVALLYWSQRRGLGLAGWGEDLSAALTQAAAGNHSVVVFFANSPPGDTERRLIKSILPKPENEAALEKGRFIKVMVKVGHLSNSEAATRYKVTSLPTLLLLGPDGVEKNRREGFVGEVDFRTGFLDCSRVEGPAAGRA